MRDNTNGLTNYTYCNLVQYCFYCVLSC